MSMTDDPLTPATRSFWDQLPHRFRQGAVMGPTELARYAFLHPSNAYRRLLVLYEAGYVRRISIGRVKHLYAGIPQKTQ